jgi:hypothetical protein
MPSLNDLREAIADALAQEKSYMLPGVCSRLGLDPGSDKEAYGSKRVYVRTRLASKSEEFLVQLAQKVLNEYSSEELAAILKAVVGTEAGVKENVKNLIFAANGPKPEIVLVDSISNDIQIVKNAEFCLVYDLPIPQTELLWSDLITWWANKNGIARPRIETERTLYKRLKESLDSEPEKLLFDTYFKNMREELGLKLPALIPQVYLHYDPYTVRNLDGMPRLPRQRTDFLILFSHHVRVVIEVDGKQHYSEENEKASPKRYAEMVAADRQLRLAGYDVYRFGGFELQGKSGRLVVEAFFRELLRKHGILPNG